MRVNSGETFEVRGTLDMTSGTLTLGNDKVTRDSLVEQALQEYPLTLTECRVWDAIQTVIPGTAAADDLGLVGGTWGSAAPMIQTIDAKSAGTTAYTRFRFTLPPEYMSTGSVKVVLAAGTVAAADTSSTLDLVCYKDDEAGGISADLCATAAQSINAAVAEKTFTITASALAPGDVLDFRVSIIIVDAAGGSAVVGKITRVVVQLDIKG